MIKKSNLSFKKEKHSQILPSGPKVPKAKGNWRGGLNVTYRTGPGFKDPNLRLRLEVHNKLETRRIHDVIGTITGREEPDRYVIMGNHRDAWAFGAADPGSGTAILMEMSRGLGKLLREGWRPRRSIMLCSWDAEEAFVFGSTEWVEDNAKVLSSRAVAYLNMDVAVGGNFTLNTDATPLLCDLLLSTAKEVTDPTATGESKSLYEVMLERDTKKHKNKIPTCDNLAVGSDYVAFYHLLGVNSADWAYIFADSVHGIRRSYPVYHSVHDSFYWMKSFVDPHFKIHRAVAQYASLVLLKLSDTPLLPMNTIAYVKRLNKEIDQLKKDSRLQGHDVDLHWLSEAMNKFENASKRFEEAKRASQGESKFAKLRVLNDQVIQLEKAFIQKGNHKRGSHDVIYGSGFDNVYRGIYFPRIQRAIRDAHTRKDWEKVKKEVSVLTFCLNSAAKILTPIVWKD